MGFICLLILIAFGLYLFAIKPSGELKSDFFKRLEKYFYAHRGLWNDEEGVPENSLTAFRRAVERGYGIELDIQMTSDGKLVVFHDSTLTRMCGIDKKLVDCSYDELQNYRLKYTEEKIPTLNEVLEIVNKKVPLIIEVKADGDYLEATKKLAERMDNYGGLYCMESFSPLAVEWYKKNRHDIVRGQLSTNYFADDANRDWNEKFMLTNLMYNFKSSPDFIAYNFQYEKQFTFRLVSTLYKPENVAWTVRSQEELNKAKNSFQMIIFEGFIPSDITFNANINQDA